MAYTPSEAGAGLRIQDSTAAGSPIHSKDEARGIVPPGLKEDTTGTSTIPRSSAIDRLIPNQTTLANAMITRQIFCVKPQFNYLKYVRMWGNWVG
jgi:hypothetical protein